MCGSPDGHPKLTSACVQGPDPLALTLYGWVRQHALMRRVPVQDRDAVAADFLGLLLREQGSHLPWLPPPQLEAYLTGALRRFILTELFGRARLELVGTEVEGIPECMGASGGGGNDPLDHLLDESERQWFWQQIEGILGFANCRILWHHYVEGWSTAEIVLALDRTEPTVRQRMSRSRRLLSRNWDSKNQRFECHNSEAMPDSC